MIMNFFLLRTVILKPQVHFNNVTTTIQPFFSNEGVTKSAKQKKGNKSNGPPTKGSNAKWSNSKKAQEGRNPAASKKLATGNIYIDRTSNLVLILYYLVHSTKGSNSSFTLSTKSNCTTKDLTIIASEGMHLGNFKFEKLSYKINFKI